MCCCWWHLPTLAQLSIIIRCLFINMLESAFFSRNRWQESLFDKIYVPLRVLLAHVTVLSILWSQLVVPIIKMDSLVKPWYVRWPIIQELTMLGYPRRHIVKYMWVRRRFSKTVILRSLDLLYNVSAIHVCISIDI